MTKPAILLLFVGLLAVATGQFGGLLGGKGSNPINSGISGISNAATGTLKLFTQQFGDFKSQFNKVYSSPEEEKKRLGIFSTNQELIDGFNKAGSSFILKASQYADLALDEFNKLINGLHCDRSKTHADKFVPQESKIPEKVDLRDEGLVTPAKFQGQCASCYAFATSAALEGHLKKKTGKLETLSPQNVLDCSAEKPYTNTGCSGGTIDTSFDYIKAKGINSDTIYPYQPKADQCKYQENNSIGTIKGYSLLDEGDEKGLEEAVATKGPVAVGIDAGHESFQHYGGGIYYEPKCRSTIDAINHAVLVVGYTPEYWICKNSYGPEWGENGFIKITRNVTNHCAIATYAVCPEV